MPANVDTSHNGSVKTDFYWILSYLQDFLKFKYTITEVLKQIKNIYGYQE